MPARFVHLHLHTEFSLADSTIRVPEKPDYARPEKAGDRPNLLSRAVELQLPALAVTDRNNLFALVKFYKAAESVGIKPIAGADVLVADGGDAPSQLTLLCRDQDGYLSLSRLLSRAWLEGQRGDCVAINPEWLRDDHKGLFAIAGRASLAGRLVQANRHDVAEAQLAEWRRVFGDDLHLELTRTGRDGEEAFNAFALQAAGKLGVPVVASNDVRFLDAAGFGAHEARVCISSGRVLEDPRRPRDYSAQQYLRSSEEMVELFADVPDALDNTVALAQRCNLQLKLGTYFLPAYPVPADETLDSWIRGESRRGLEARLQKNPLAPGKTREDYDARLEFELDTIIKMGFPGYFLIVADFIQWGKNQGIPIGPGRGSGAGSLVAWALQITDLDPLPYNLLFERFLNPERVSMPDFDIDFCMDRRDEVIDYVARKYGRERVSQIITYGTMAAKAVLRDTGRVLGFGYGMVDSIAKLIPNILGISLKDAMGQGKGGMASEMASPELIQRYESEDDVRDLIDLALQLEDLTRNAGKHAGGVVIAPTPLSDFCPLYAEHDHGTLGKNPVTQFDKDDVEAVGLVKFDFLGLRTLTIIDWAVKAINARRAGSTSVAEGRMPESDRLATEGAAPIDIATIPLDDASVYRNVFANGNTGSVFQFESSGMRRALKDAKPDRFEDLIALNALYRPGPMEMIPSFVARKHGTRDVRIPRPAHPGHAARDLRHHGLPGAGHADGADRRRLLAGRRRPAAPRDGQEGAGRNGQAPRDLPRGRGQGRCQRGDKADEIFDLMEKFAGYGFNKSHAAAYSLVAYQTAWLKQHYPAEFMAATLSSSDMDKTDKVVAFLDEARGLGLTVLPPDVNASRLHVRRHRAGHHPLRPGRSEGRGPGRVRGDRGRAAMATDRSATCWISASASTAAGLNKRTLEALIRAGAMDALAVNRASLMLQLPEAMKATDQMAKNQEAGMFDMFGGARGGGDIRVELPETCTEWPLAQLLQGERDTLGHYLSGHPMDPYRDDVQKLVGHDLSALAGIWEGAARNSRPRGRPQLAADGADRGGGPGGRHAQARRQRRPSCSWKTAAAAIECGFFNEQWTEFAPLLTRDRMLVVEGGLREDEFNGGYSLRASRCWDFAADLRPAGTSAYPSACAWTCALRGLRSSSWSRC